MSTLMYSKLRGTGHTNFKLRTYGMWHTAHTHTHTHTLNKTVNGQVCIM